LQSNPSVSVPLTSLCNSNIADDDAPISSEETDESEREVPLPVQRRRLRQRIEDSDSEDTDHAKPRGEESEDEGHIEGIHDPAAEVGISMDCDVDEDSVSRESTRLKHQTDVPLSHTPV
jgi:hypothetical protein